MNRRHWIFLSLTIALLLLSSALLLRQPILDLIINKVKDRVKERFGATLIIGDAGFVNFRDVFLKDIIVVPPNSTDTLFRMKNLEVSISLRKLIRFRVAFNELIVDSVDITLVKHDSTDNFSFFFKKKNAETDTLEKIDTHGFNDRFESIYDRVNDIFSDRITIRQLTILYHKDQNDEMVKIPELFFDKGVFQSSVITSSLEGVNLWTVKGTTDAVNGNYNFSVDRIKGAPFALPFFDLYDGFRICFDKAHLQFKTDVNEEDIPFNGHFDLTNLLLNHWRIAPEDVLIPRTEFALNALISTDSVKLLPGTVFTMNKLPVNIAVAYIRNPEQRFKLDIGFKVKNAQDFFGSLPNGMFHSLKGFKAGGELSYALHFDLPVKNPDALVFDSELKKNGFHIIQYGTEYFPRINIPFSYLAMDGDKPKRSFTVGPENPMYTPSAEIPDYIKNVILTAEDPSFFTHGGFVEQSFQESIISNIKAKRFARGGSTISMQLVKNCFLSRNKTISRKLEEIMIVWLIERNGLVNKERMFEVYLNVIELGPDVYGIGEASRFYFGKLPRELTLAESIFLASIIPHPKQFRYSFDSSGNLKPFMTNYFNLVAGRLVKREKISQAEADSLHPNVRLSGMALDIVLPPDTILIDTSEFVPALN